MLHESIHACRFLKLIVCLCQGQQVKDIICLLNGTLLLLYIHVMRFTPPSLNSHLLCVVGFACSRHPRLQPLRSFQP